MPISLRKKPQCRGIEASSSIEIVKQLCCLYEIIFSKLHIDKSGLAGNQLLQCMQVCQNSAYCNGRGEVAQIRYNRYDRILEWRTSNFVYMCPMFSRLLDWIRQSTTMGGGIDVNSKLLLSGSFRAILVSFY